MSVTTLSTTAHGGTAAAGIEDCLDTAIEGVRTVTILGSTGSIGCSTLDIIQHHPEKFRVEALTANSRVAELAEQAKAVNAKRAVICDDSRYQDLKDALAGTGIEAAAGVEAVRDAADGAADLVMAGIVGAAGLAGTLAAAQRGATVALANKETLVCAGDLFMEEVAKSGATLLPVDSEHNAIFQVFDAERREGIEKIILTASGGPFRTKSRGEMAEMTPEQAVKHPNWSMGAKISIDSATMMNKGLELIEAHHLFQMGEERIDILVHPQSVIHSMVAYVDGSVLAQLGSPDMRTPIAYALAWPARCDAPVERLDLGKVATLTFEAPDDTRFPSLRLAREALKNRGSAPNVLNAANEIAVEAFLGKRIRFTDIAAVVEEVIDGFNHRDAATIEEVVAIDQEARRRAAEAVAARR